MRSHVTKLKLAVGALLVVQGIGTIGFMLLENLPFLDALYLTITTLTTVGYGDVYPRSFYGRIFDIFLMLTGVGMAFYTFTLFVSLAIEGQLQDFFGRQGMQRRIEALHNHIIVCGSGKVGMNVIERLKQENQPFVVIEQSEENVKELIQNKVLVVKGDATIDEVLFEAGLKRAKGVITTLPHDSENVYVTLTAKSLNSDITIVARAERPEAEGKLRRAGADNVIFPSVMGGRQMVTAMTKPIILDLMEKVFYSEEIHLDMAEIEIKSGSDLIGKSLIDNGIREKYQAIVVAIKRGDDLVVTPDGKEIVQAGDILIAIGRRIPLNEMSLAAGRI